MQINQAKRIARTSVIGALLLSFFCSSANAQSWAERQQYIQQQNNLREELFIQQQEMEDAQRKQEEAMRDIERERERQADKLRDMQEEQERMKDAYERELDSRQYEYRNKEISRQLEEKWARDRQLRNSIQEAQERVENSPDYFWERASQGEDITSAMANRKIPPSKIERADKAELDRLDRDVAEYNARETARRMAGNSPAWQRERYYRELEKLSAKEQAEASSALSSIYRFGVWLAITVADLAASDDPNFDANVELSKRSQEIDLSMWGMAMRAGSQSDFEAVVAASRDLTIRLAKAGQAYKYPKCGLAALQGIIPCPKNLIYQSVDR